MSGKTRATAWSKVKSLTLLKGLANRLSTSDMPVFHVAEWVAHSSRLDRVAGGLLDLLRKCALCHMAKLLALQLQSDHFHCFFDYK